MTRPLSNEIIVGTLPIPLPLTYLTEEEGIIGSGLFLIGGLIFWADTGSAAGLAGAVIAVIVLVMASESKH